MRESIIFLNYIFARFGFGGENNFSIMLSIGKVRRVKRYGRYLSMQEYGVKVFIFSVWLCFGKNIGLRYNF